MLDNRDIAHPCRWGRWQPRMLACQTAATWWNCQLFPLILTCILLPEAWVCAKSMGEALRRILLFISMVCLTVALTLFAEYLFSYTPNGYIKEYGYRVITSVFGPFAEGMCIEKTRICSNMGHFLINCCFLLYSLYIYFFFLMYHFYSIWRKNMTL